MTASAPLVAEGRSAGAAGIRCGRDTRRPLANRLGGGRQRALGLGRILGKKGSRGEFPLERPPPHGLKLGLGAHSCSRSTVGGAGTELHSRPRPLPAAQAFPDRWPVSGARKPLGSPGPTPVGSRSIETTPHTRCPLLPARCPHRCRALGAQSSPAGAPPPPLPLPCPLPHNPRRGVAEPTDPPKPTPCRAPPPQRSTPAPGPLRSPQPGRQTRSNFRAQPEERGLLTARFLQVKHSPRRLHLLRAGEGCRQLCPLGFQELQGRHRVRLPGLLGGRPPEWKSPLPLPLGALPASGARSFPNPLRVSVAHPLTDAGPPGSNPADSPAETLETRSKSTPGTRCALTQACSRHRRPAPDALPAQPPPPRDPRSERESGREKEPLS